MRTTLFIFLAACAAEQPAPTPAPVRATTPGYNRLNRADFNRLAAERDWPLFWRQDKNNDGTLSADELAVLWGVASTTREVWVKDGGFTAQLATAYEDMVAWKNRAASNLTDDETVRRAAVRKELAQTRPTLIDWNFSGSSEEDRAIVAHVVAAALHIEKLYATQRGAIGLQEKIPADDAQSRMLFYRNQGPWCEQPETRNDSHCNALSTFPKKISGAYPAALQSDAKFCERLAEKKEAAKTAAPKKGQKPAEQPKDLMSPFVVVRGEAPNLAPVPYTEAFRDEMTAVSAELRAAADAIKSPDEAALKAYLLADAQAFLDNNWLPADEAWAKMSVHNSKWYLRIAPDETYADPCDTKAGFQVSFARINTGSLKWQALLDPLKNDMEKYIAGFAGEPYKARSVSFHLPDFIDIVLNAGDARPANGATIGESLPNFGPVANEGRGRTVAMTNFYTDADSIKVAHSQAEAIFSAETVKNFSDDPEPLLLTTVLHEAAHNLGPSHQYKVGGKIDREAFGGPLASMLEELKAQTGSLVFCDWLAEKKQITDKQAILAHVRDVFWNFGHISQGFYDEAQKLRAYSVLSGIQLGYLLAEGAVTFDPNALAADGKSKGALTIHTDKFAAAAKKMMTEVAKIKATGNKAAAEAMLEKYIGAKSAAQPVFAMVTERMRSAPRATFVYSVGY